MVFQDSLFDSSRMVARVLEGGIHIRMRLRPLAGERVRVLEYARKAPGGLWQRQKVEEGRVVTYSSLKLPLSFEALFGVQRKDGVILTPSRRKRR